VIGLRFVGPSFERFDVDAIGVVVLFVLFSKQVQERLVVPQSDGFYVFAALDSEVAAQSAQPIVDGRKQSGLCLCDLGEFYSSVKAVFGGNEFSLAFGSLGRSIGSL
jgi:hypothetical protein